jgi:hypothetical protein
MVNARRQWFRGHEALPVGIPGLLIFTIVVGVGLFVLFLMPSRVDWLSRIDPSIERNWHRLFAFYLLAVALSGLAISYATHGMRRLGDVSDRDGEDHLAPASVWPPVVLGAIEIVLYTTTLLMGQAAFIGVWLILKVAGRWGDWQERGQEARNRFQGFLVGTALSLVSAGVTFGLIRGFVGISE